MRSTLAKCLICAFFSTVTWGQAPAESPSFVAADVHVSPKTSSETGIILGAIRGTQVEMRNATMLLMINRAYAIDSDRILGGPRWLELDKFDVIAKVPPGTKNDALGPMLKALLADRFKLEAHEDKRPLPAFTLTVGKGKPKLQPGSGETRCSINPPAPEVKFRQVLVCKGYTMANFAGILRSLGNPLVSSQVIDKTGLQGTFDFEFEFTPPQQMAAAGGDGINFFDAVEKLGLKLEQTSTPQTVLVIDRVNQTPTENAPGVEALMDPPPPPPTLDVSTVKPAATDGKGFGLSMRSDQGGAVFDGRGVKIATLLQLGFDLPTERVIGLPPNADAKSWDVMARVAGQMGGILSIKTVMQQLLTERFNFKFHMEDRPIDAYRLVAVKPKMAKADPENRASCKEGPAPGAKDPRQQTPSRSRLITCRNVTMAEFAERLQGLSGGYVRTPIVDATKLEGMWDFTLNFSPPPPTALGLAGAPTTAPAPTSAAAAGPAPTALGASDPSDALTLFEAVASQLGLKLELEKRPLPVLVIDHIDDGPTEN